MTSGSLKLQKEKVMGSQGAFSMRCVVGAGTQESTENSEGSHGLAAAWSVRPLRPSCPLSQAVQQGCPVLYHASVLEQT